MTRRARRKMTVRFHPGATCALCGAAEHYPADKKFTAQCPLSPPLSTVNWLIGDKAFVCKVEQGGCPFCLAPAVTALPPPLLAEQSDGTTHVCHPALGGCNHGFVRAVKP